MARGKARGRWDEGAARRRRPAAVSEWAILTFLAKATTRFDQCTSCGVGYMSHSGMAGAQEKLVVMACFMHETNTLSVRPTTLDR
jgi:hypothetical protein